MMLRLVLTLVGFSFLASICQAHDMWILPSSFHSQPGERLSVDLRVGHAGDDESLDRLDERIIRFEQIGAATQRDIPGLDRRRPAGFVRAEEPGLEILVYESTPAWSELPAAAFESYLAEEGLEIIAKERRVMGTSHTPGRELYSRSLKSLVVIAGNEPLRDRVTGLPLELVVETYRVPGLPVKIRAEFRGEPLVGTWIKARRLDEAETRFSARSDRDGRVTFPLEPGSWILSTVHMIPHVPEDPENAEKTADWRTFFSTLTFDNRSDPAQPSSSAPPSLR